jgi:hypothetical protein
MANRIPRRCLYVDVTNGQCRELTVEGPYCADHKRERARDRKASRIVTDTAEWKQLTDHLKGCGNTICSYVDDYDVRCRRPMWGAHHIIDAAARPDLAYDWRNIVPLCHDHHNSVTFSAEKAASARYVPTAWAVMGIVVQEDIRLMPDATATREQIAKLWTLANTVARCAGEMNAIE